MKQFSLITPLLLGLFTTSLYSQKLSLSGSVVSGSGQPIATAKVFIYEVNPSAQKVLKITDLKGQFQCFLDTGKTYTLLCRKQGYKERSISIIPNKNTSLAPIILEPVVQLKEVVVQKKTPVIVKQDTLIYAVDNFSNGRERKLKELLKKLPGMEVNKEGGIKVNGKAVSKLFVDGKKFFGGGTQMAVENIPADAIKEIVAIDNFTEIPFLKELSESNVLALNIKLKEDKKQFVFGDVAVATDASSYHKENVALFYYAPETTVNSILDFNNTNTKAISINDYMKFKEGLTTSMSKVKSNRSQSREEFRTLFRKDNVTSNDYKFGAISLSKQLTNKVDLSAYGLAQHKLTRSKSDQENNYLLANDAFREENRTTSRQNSGFGLFKLQIDYNAKGNNRIYGDTQLNYSINNPDQQATTTIGDIQNVLHNTFKINYLNLNQNFEWHKRWSKKWTTSLLATNAYSTQDHRDYWETNNILPLSLLDQQNNQEFDRLQQERDNYTHDLHTELTTYLKYAKRSHAYATLALDYSKYEDNFEQLSGIGLMNRTNFNSSNAFPSSNFSFYKRNVVLGLHHKLKRKSFTFTTGLYYGIIYWQTNQISRVKNDSYFIPELKVKWEISDVKKLSFTYTSNNSLVAPTDFNTNPLVTQFNTLMVGNSDLLTELSDTASLNYSQIDLFNGLFLNASLNYTKNNRYSRNNQDIIGINRIASTRQLNITENNISSFFGATKKLKQVAFKMSGRLALGENYAISNSEIFKNENFNQNIDLSTTFTFEKFPSVLLGYSFSSNQIVSESEQLNFSTQNPYTEIAYSKGSFDVFVKYSKSFTRGSNNMFTNTFDNLSAEINYNKPDSPLSLNFSMQNVLNNQFIINNTISNNFSSTQRSFILPRVLLLGISYKI